MSITFNKINNTINIISNINQYQTRNDSTIWCIFEANKIYKWPDFKNITVYTDDFEKNIMDYTYSKKNNYNRLIPDFNFF